MVRSGLLLSLGMSARHWLSAHVPAPLRKAALASVVAQFSRLYYNKPATTWRDTRWLGIGVEKLPSDLWIYQEILTELRPDLIIETGTLHGGSALYLASMCELLGHGQVVTVDVEDRSPYPQHERIEYRTASSTDPALLGELAQRAADLETVLVILDSGHSRAHVLAELHAYAPLVSVDSYFVVEDTAVNGHPLHWKHGPGPMEAVTEFMRGRTDFVADRAREKFLMTWNPKGYLRRVR